MKNFKNAFTLSEILMTLVVIGIVAMFVVPSTMNNVRRAYNVSGAQKAFGTLNEIIEYAYMDNICIGKALYPTPPATPPTTDPAKSQYEYERDCADTASGGQFADSQSTLFSNLFYKMLITKSKDTSASPTWFVTRDNVRYTFSDFNLNSCGFMSDKRGGPTSGLVPAAQVNTACAKITVDVDGQGTGGDQLTDYANKKWNDQFEFYLFKDGVFSKEGEDVTTIKK